MVELSMNAKKVYEAMLALGATSEEKGKSADQIMEKARLGKGQVNAGLQELVNKGIVKRKAKQKRAKYWIVQKI